PVQNYGHGMCGAVVVLGVNEETLPVVADIVDDLLSCRDLLARVGLEKSRRSTRVELVFGIHRNGHQLRIGSQEGNFFAITARTGVLARVGRNLPLAARVAK